MTLGQDGLRAAALSFPGAYEDYPFGPETTVFKVRAPSGGANRAGKVFALCRLDVPEPDISFKCDPELAPQLRAANPGIIPGYHLNKRHWNTVDLTAVEAEMVLDMLEDSYDLVVAGMSRKLQEALKWSARVAKG